MLDEKAGKILILGSEGFIGVNLCAAFLDEGYEVSGIDRVLKRSEVPYRYFQAEVNSAGLGVFLKNLQPDICIMAAGSGSVPFSYQQPATDFRANVSDTIDVFEAIRINFPSCRLVYLSSAAVYGNVASSVVREEEPASPISPYGYHKLMGELACRQYFSNYGIGCCIVRPFSVYGPGLRKQLFWDLHRKTLAEGKEIVLSGTGLETRDFVFVTDLATAIVLLAKKATFDAGVYNIGSGIETTIREASDVFLDALSCGKQIRFDGIGRVGDPTNWRAGISRISELGFRTSVNIREGLGRVASWLKSEH